MRWMLRTTFLTRQWKTDRFFVGWRMSLTVVLGAGAEHVGNGYRN